MNKPFVYILIVALLAGTSDAGQAAPVAATYYVDFADGDDAADGTSPATAWKHAPGAPQLSL